MRAQTKYFLVITVAPIATFFSHLTSNLIRGRDSLAGMPRSIVEVTLMVLVWCLYEDFLVSDSNQNDSEKTSQGLTRFERSRQISIKHIAPILILWVLVIRIDGQKGSLASLWDDFRGRTFLGLSLFFGVWLAAKAWLAMKRESIGSIQLYNEYRNYLDSQKHLEELKKVPYETFSPPLSFKEWKKQEKRRE